jgi:hypothetical protein
VVGGDLVDEAHALGLEDGQADRLVERPAQVLEVGTQLRMQLAAAVQCQARELRAEPGAAGRRGADDEPLDAERRHEPVHGRAGEARPLRELGQAEAAVLAVERA